MTKQKKFSLDQLTLPLFVIGLAAFLIWGVVSIVSVEKGYKELVQELHSKTFGNRWVAAYELSKFLSNNKIPEEDMDWFVSQLSAVYQSTQDERTKVFITTALASLESDKVIPFLNKGLQSESGKILFQVLVGMANSKTSQGLNLERVKQIAQDSEDSGIQQLAVFTLAQHQFRPGIEVIRPLVNSKNEFLRYSAVIGMIRFSELDFLGQARALFENNAEKTGKLDPQQYNLLKKNVLTALSKVDSKKRDRAIDFIESLALKDSNLNVSTYAQKVLIELKK
jgi:hypothetical protein